MQDVRAFCQKPVEKRCRNPHGFLRNGRGSLPSIPDTIWAMSDFAFKVLIYLLAVVSTAMLVSLVFAH
jgi:hypothetical protein